MGQGIDLAALTSPEHAAMIDDLKDQLLIVFLKRLGGDVRVPVEEVDATGRYCLAMSLDGRTFHFKLEEKA